MNAAQIENDTLRLWHGAHYWSPPIEVRAPKSGQAEAGAGLYLCAHYLNARSYAKGGGSVIDVRVRSDLRFLEDIEVDVHELIAVAKVIPRLKRRQAILDDLVFCGERARDGKIVGLNALVNLAINNDAMVGAPAVAITEFIVSKGADASLNRRSNGDDWLVVFNPKVVVQAKARPAADVGLAEYERPPVLEQLAACDRWRAQCAAAAQGLSPPLKARDGGPVRSLGP